MTTVIEPLLTSAEVAAILRKKTRTIDSWRDPGSTVALPFVRIAGQPRYRKADVQNFINASLCIPGVDFGDKGEPTEAVV